MDLILVSFTTTHILLKRSSEHWQRFRTLFTLLQHEKNVMSSICTGTVCRLRKITLHWLYAVHIWKVIFTHTRHGNFIYYYFASWAGLKYKFKFCKSWWYHLEKLRTHHEWVDWGIFQATSIRLQSSKREWRIFKKRKLHTVYIFTSDSSRS